MVKGPKSLAMILQEPYMAAGGVGSSDRKSGVAFDSQRNRQLGWQLQIDGVNPGTVGVYSKRCRVIAV